MWLKPTWTADHIAEFPPEKLIHYGVKGVILDLDNTLMIPKNLEVPDFILSWIEAARQAELRLYIVSNNCRPFYLQKAEQMLGIPIIGNSQKPRVTKLKRAIQALELEPHEVVMVGDRPLTDIWAGHRVGSKTLWVQPLSRTMDPLVIKCLRFLESRFIVPELV